MRCFLFITDMRERNFPCSAQIFLHAHDCELPNIARFEVVNTWWEFMIKVLPSDRTASERERGSEREIKSHPLAPPTAHRPTHIKARRRCAEPPNQTRERSHWDDCARPAGGQVLIVVINTELGGSQLKWELEGVLVLHLTLNRSHNRISCSSNSTRRYECDGESGSARWLRDYSDQCCGISLPCYLKVLLWWRSSVELSFVELGLVELSIRCRRLCVSSVLFSCLQSSADLNRLLFLIRKNCDSPQKVTIFTNFLQITVGYCFLIGIIRCMRGRRNRAQGCFTATIDFYW